MVQVLSQSPENSVGRAFTTDETDWERRMGPHARCAKERREREESGLPFLPVVRMTGGMSHRCHNDAVAPDEIGDVVGKIGKVDAPLIKSGGLLGVAFGFWQKLQNRAYRSGAISRRPAKTAGAGTAEVSPASNPAMRRAISHSQAASEPGSGSESMLTRRRSSVESINELYWQNCRCPIPKLLRRGFRKDLLFLWIGPLFVVDELRERWRRQAEGGTSPRMKRMGQRGNLHAVIPLA